MKRTERIRMAFDFFTWSFILRRTFSIRRLSMWWEIAEMPLPNWRVLWLESRESGPRGWILWAIAVTSKKLSSLRNRFWFWFCSFSLSLTCCWHSSFIDWAHSSWQVKLHSLHFKPVLIGFEQTEQFAFCNSFWSSKRWFPKYPWLRMERRMLVDWSSETLPFEVLRAFLRVWFSCDRSILRKFLSGLLIAEETGVGFNVLSGSTSYSEWSDC